MDQGIFLSFVVPVYNAEAHLTECLKSLCAQDIPDYEIICVNDGSRDRSPEIIRSFAAEHPKVILIDQPNSGVAAARNAGVNAARGEYIWFIDADDFIQENILGRLRSFLAGQPCDKLIVGAYEFTDALTEQERMLSNQGGLPTNTPWHDAVVWRSLLRRRFLTEHALSFRYPDISHGEDGLYMYEVTLAEPVCAEIPEVLYFYRVHSGSVSTVPSLENRKKKFHSYLRIVRILQEYYNGGQCTTYTANKLMTFLWFALYEAARLPRRDAAPMLRELKQAGLFPFRRLSECDLTRSYMIGRTDWIGKLFDKLYLNLHTRPGFALMHLAYLPIRLLRR